MTAKRILPQFDICKLLSKIKVNPDSDCWEWAGHRNDSGYGIITKTINGKKSQYRAHRAIYSVFIGNLDLDMVIDHTCRNRACVNPDHLRQVSDKINALENSI